MEQSRIELFKELEARIGNTPLVRYRGNVPNENTIWIKRECDNPFGSHYDRVYLALFREGEQKGLQPGMNVLEASSGSAGVSFAGIGRILGYHCYVMIPGGKQLQRRREAIAEQGAEIILTPEEEYIQGFPKRIPEFKRRLRAKFLNHSMGPRGTNNEVTLQSLESIAREVLKEITVDIYVGGMGNGSSIAGPGRVLKKYDSQVRIIGYKPKISGKNELPGLINQNGLDASASILFPHIAEAERLMDREVLVEDWNKGVVNHEDLGRTGRAGIVVALEVAKEVVGKNILVLGYDKAERY